MLIIAMSSTDHKTFFCWAFLSWKGGIYCIFFPSSSFPPISLVHPQFLCLIAVFRSYFLIYFLLAAFPFFSDFPVPCLLFIICPNNLPPHWFQQSKWIAVDLCHTEAWQSSLEKRLKPGLIFCNYQTHSSFDIPDPRFKTSDRQPEEVLMPQSKSFAYLH